MAALHPLQCEPTRENRATVTAGRGLSPESPKEALLGDVTREGGLNQKAALVDPFRG